MPLQSPSSFCRFGQRDDRRRRLLADELSHPSDWPACCVLPEADSPPQKSEHYGDAEFLGQQLRLLDLVPRRLVSLFVLVTIATTIVGGLEGSYVWMLGRVASGGAAIQALDLAAKGSLGCWFSSLLLLAASAAAVLVYAVRRHRTDDYQGRYRIWLWAAACWFLMATDQAANLREGFRELMIALSGTPLVGDGSLWWAILYALGLVAVGSRLLMDMRSSPLSMCGLLMAAIAYSAAVAGRFGWILPGLPSDGTREIMWLSGAEMLGSLTLLVAVTLYARHVILDAEGLLPWREPQPDEQLFDEEAAANGVAYPSSASGRWTKIDPPHATPQPAYQRAATPLIPTGSPVLSPVNRKLTKAERKALKERLLRERLARQQR